MGVLGRGDLGFELEEGLGSWGVNRLLGVSQKWDSLLRIVGSRLGGMDSSMGFGRGVLGGSRRIGMSG